MSYVWSDDAWADYVRWQAQDGKKVAKINELLRTSAESPSAVSASPNL